MSPLRPRLLKLLSQKRTKVLALGFGAFIVVTMIASSLFLPSYVKQFAIDQAQQKIGRQLEIADIRFSPLTLTLTASGLALLESGQKAPLLTVKKAELSLSIASLFRGALVMDEVQIDQASLHIIRTSAAGHGRYNFSDILDRIAAMPKSTQPFRFSLSNVQVQGGAIQFDDLALNKHIQISSVNLGLPFLSNFPSSTNSFVQPYLSAKINGTAFALSGRSKPFVDSLETTLAIDIDQLDLPSYVAYLPFPLPAKLQSAKLSTKLDLIFDRKNHQTELLLSGDIKLDSFLLKNKNEQSLLKAHSVKAHIQRMNVFSQAASIESLQVDTPEIWLDLDEKGQSSWNEIIQFTQPKSDIVAPATTIPSMEKPTKPLITIKEFLLDHGKLNFSDAFHASPVQTVQLNEIKFDAKQISTALNAKAAVISLAARTEETQTLSFHGEYNASNGELAGNAALDSFQLGQYQAIANRYIAAKINGVVSIKSQIHMHQGQLKLDEMGVQLHDLLIVPVAKNEGQVAIKLLQLEKLNLNTETRLVHVSGLTVGQLDADIRRDADAKLSVLKMLASTKSSGSSTATQSSLANEQDIRPTDWVLTLQNLLVKDSSFLFEDHAVSPAVLSKAQDINLTAENLSSDLSQVIGMKWTSSINGKGKLVLIASATPKLRKISLDVDGQQLPVASLYPYFSRALNVELLDGNANVKGKMGLLNTEGKPLVTSFEGALSLNDFQVMEKGRAEDFINWKSINLEGVNLSFGDAKQFIFLRKLGLNDFYTKLVLSEKGQLNIRDMLTKNAAPKSANSSAVEQANGQMNAVSPTAPEIRSDTRQPIEITIEKTSISGGNINFKDNFIKPSYQANLTGVSGNIGLISSVKPAPASVQLSGKIDDDAPLLISGSVNPLSTPIFLDIKGSATDIQLTRLSQYASKYVGYPIVRGHLSVEVSYHIEKQKLVAENSLKLDQLTLGEWIGGPDATRLPVNLALALLHDNDGKIAVDLPISGSLSDPQFSLGGIIFRAFVNIITKAVTSPFAMLGSMFGGGEELAFGEFARGKTDLTPATTAKLDSLAKALKERTKLRLDITGRVDPISDAEGLRLASVDGKITAIKLRELRKKNPAIQPQEVVVDEMDRKTYIEEVYNAEKFTKQRNLVGIAKTLAPQEALSLVLRNTVVTQEDLRSLAQQRAEVVLDYLEQRGGIGQDRLFLIAPRLDVDGIKDKGLANRVDFALK